MKTLLIALALALLAAPLAASTTICTVDFFQVDAFGIAAFVYRFTFYNDDEDNIGGTVDTNEPGWVDAQTDCDSRIANADENKKVSHYGALQNGLLGNPAPELLRPEFPEDCVTVLADPDNTTPIPSTVEKCRMSEFYNFTLLQVWPQDILANRDFFFEIWDWISSPGGQGGAGLNTGEQAAWLGLTIGQRSTAASRYNNLEGVISGFVTDETNWEGTELVPPE